MYRNTNFRYVFSVFIVQRVIWKKHNVLPLFPVQASSPSCTELETEMMDWLGKALQLPPKFIHEGNGPGAGVIQGKCFKHRHLAIIIFHNIHSL